MGDMGTAISKTPMLHPTVAKPSLGEAQEGRQSFPWETEYKRGTRVCGLATPSTY